MQLLFNYQGGGSSSNRMPGEMSIPTPLSHASCTVFNLTAVQKRPTQASSRNCWSYVITISTTLPGARPGRFSVPELAFAAVSAVHHRYQGDFIP
jgi:hypothetical protein